MTILAMGLSGGSADYGLLDRGPSAMTDADMTRRLREFLSAVDTPRILYGFLGALARNKNWPQERWRDALRVWSEQRFLVKA